MLATMVASTPFAFSFPLFPPQASSVARDVDFLYFITLGLTAFFSLGIAVALVFLAVRYRRRTADEIGEDAHGHPMLEVVWSVIPLIVVLGLFFYGAKLFFALSRPPANAVEYFATGKQWMWKFQHPNGQREINHLHVPVGVPIKVTMTSEDVIHSFFVPDFRVKMDVVPGRYSTVWFEATRPGQYRLFCAEYCGAEHSQMGGWVIVMQGEDYEDWLAGNRMPMQRASGEELFQKFACHTCHRTESSARAPILAGVFGKSRIFQDGASLSADENYIRESILNPQARVVAGYQPIMPTFQGQIREEEVLELVQYIRSLQ